MRKEVIELEKLGRMPNESIDDDESVDDVIASYSSILDKITLPITYEEGGRFDTIVSRTRFL
jgi:hypothetical protein